MKSKGCLAVYISLCLALTMLTGAGFTAEALSSDSGFQGSIILGRPNNTAITASVVSDKQSQVYLEWGDASGVYSKKSAVYEASSLEPANLIMDGLSANSTFYYRLLFKEAGAAEFKNTAEYTFQTPFDSPTD